MPLNVVVCVKNTPASLSVAVDAATGKVKRDGLQLALNPFDEYAVEEAVRIKEKNPGSTATVVTVGPESSENALREAISRGCDAGVLVTGPEFSGGDTFAVSRALAAAVKKIGAEKPVHLVLFGKNSNDGNDGAVGAQVAAWLDWPGVSSVKKIDGLTETGATVERLMEEGSDILKVRLPAALATVKEINEPRLPSLKGKMAAKKAPIPRWGCAELGLAAGDAGDAGSKAVITHESPPPARPDGVRVDGASAAEKAARLVDLLIERKLI